jgi:Tfp pilus assembly PilM family ATPase
MNSKGSRILSHTFPVPNYLTLSPVGLDISPQSVRIMKLKRDPVGHIPEFYKEIKLNKVCSLLETDEDVKNCSNLREVLASLKKEFDLKFVNVSLPELKTYIFKTTVPIEAANTIEETLAFKIEENVPLDPGEVVFDYNVLQSGKDDHNHIDVAVSVIPKNIIRSYTKLLKELGMVPLSFETESQALAQAVIDKNDHGPYLLMNFGPSMVGINIVDDNVAHYASSISLSSEDIVADLKGSSAQALKEQVNKLLVYWFTNKSDADHKEKIKTVIVTGSYATAPGLIEFLEKHLAIKIKVANVWQNCFSLEEYIPDIKQKDSLNYGIAIGLALNTV